MAGKRSAAPAALLALALACAPLSGCMTGWATVGMPMRGDQTIEIRVDGRSPQLVLTNRGPGPVRLRIEAHESHEEVEIGPRVTLRRTLREPAHLWITAPEETTIDVDLRNYSGIRIDT